LEDLEYFPDTFKALQLFQKLGFTLFIITNQSGVGRGYFSIEIVHLIHDQIQKDLIANKLEPFKEFSICPHSPDENCDCRKPSGKMIQNLMKKYKVNPQKSYMVGDKLIDAEAGKNAHIQGILVRHTSSPDYPSYKTLLEFAESLKKN
jgi:histidinol-phosphate phosphatase family protein